ncbi:MAG: hypothetical protein ACT4P2_07640 [Pseudomonadota bacterium]
MIRPPTDICKPGQVAVPAAAPGVSMPSPRVWRSLAALGLAACLLSGGAWAAGRLEPEILSSQQALAAQAELSHAPPLDFTTVLVARLTIDGEAVDVTSISPVTLRSLGAGATESRTIIRFAADRQSLVFFTRELASGQGHRLVIPVAELDNGPAFAFPVLLPGGAPKEARIEVKALFRRP